MNPFNLIGVHGLASVLIDNGADLAIKDVNGDTILHYATKNEKLKVLQKLLDAGNPYQDLNMVIHA